MISRLDAWRDAHALAMLVAVAASLLAGSSLWVCLVALVSFAALLLRERGAWTVPGRFGLANLVTLGRLGIVLVSLGLGPPSAGLALLLGIALLLDGLDGFLARRAGLSSPFGALFDEEVDALLVLAASLGLAERLGLWVLTPGLLRHVTVLAHRLWPPNNGAMPRSSLGRLAFVAVTVGLIGALLTEGLTALACAAVGALAVGLSFGRGYYHSYAG